MGKPLKKSTVFPGLPGDRRQGIAAVKSVQSAAGRHAAAAAGGAQRAAARNARAHVTGTGDAAAHPLHPVRARRGNRRLPPLARSDALPPQRPGPGQPAPSNLARGSTGLPRELGWR